MVKKRRKIKEMKTGTVQAVGLADFGSVFHCKSGLIQKELGKGPSLTFVALCLSFLKH